MSMELSVLAELAEKYETAEFLKQDPSQFMHRYDSKKEQEIVAFLAANLAFGRRSQILAHVEQVLSAMGGAPSEWILSSKYDDFFCGGKKSFYRMYSHDAMRLFFDAQRKILLSFGTLGGCFKSQWEKERADGGERLLCQIIAANFPAECNLVPHTADSAAKKLNMFLRWMVRKDSPVDLGLWDWFSPSDLLMPLDTHVMQEATRLGLVAPGSGGKVRAASMRVCMELTDKMREIFPNDPVRGDFALFGLGVDGERE